MPGWKYILPMFYRKEWKEISVSMDIVLLEIRTRYPSNTKPDRLPLELTRSVWILIYCLSVCLLPVDTPC
jgi:hypothetical protein